jgi:hypothetical protein
MRLPTRFRTRFSAAATRLILGLAVAASLAAAPPLAAQTADIVRGRVIDDSTRALIGAVVSITRGPDRLVQQVMTDSAGFYSSRFDPGTGDYLVHVASPGFRPARRRVEWVGAERELVADFTMGRDLAILAAVNVRAKRALRAEAEVASPYEREVGATETYSQGVEGRVSPNAAGNLNTIAGTIPGITMTPGGPALLGSPSTSNLTTLNGMALPGGSLPRAAKADVRVSGATFDATRGGFAGANIDVRLGAGDRNYQNRNAYLTLNAPQLQVTDAVGRSLGLTNGGFRASAGADGELMRRTLTYNVALDAGRTVSDPTTLLGGNGDALRRAGLSPDSALRVQAMAGAIGLRLAGVGVPSARVQNSLTWLGRLDDVRDTLRTLTLTTYLGRTSNLHRLLLSESDSLFLTKEQIGPLLVADSLYSAKIRALYRPLAEFLASQPEGVAGKAALDTVKATTKLYWPIFWDQVDLARPIITPQQRELVPLFNNISGVTQEQRKNSQWQFGFPVPLVHNTPRIGGQPGSVNTSINRSGD